MVCVGAKQYREKIYIKEVLRVLETSTSKIPCSISLRHVFDAIMGQRGRKPFVFLSLYGCHVVMHAQHFMIFSPAVAPPSLSVVFCRVHSPSNTFSLT
jgi:hypothetical protein